jgi:hypothetical protein
VVVGGDHAVTNNPDAPGPYYSGQSITWIDEQVNLNAYAGKQVLVRFEYLTDGSDSRTGVVLDDLGILEMGSLDDAESPVSIWQADGFLRVPDAVAQNWSVTVIVRDADGRNTVFPVTLDMFNTGRATFTVPDGGRATLVIGAMAPFTSYLADYKISVHQGP